MGVVVDDALVVDFADARQRIEPGHPSTFGRAGAITLDEANPYLHRVVGQFIWHGSRWWVENLAPWTDLTLEADNGTRAVALSRDRDGPPRALPLLGSSSTLGFHAGPANYELVLYYPRHDPPSAHPAPPGVRTARFAHIALTAEERRLLELLIAQITSGCLPTNTELAADLGWSASKLNRKLDYLCTRLTKAGVPGLIGDRGSHATDRRRRLAEHAMTTHLLYPQAAPEHRR